MYFMNKISNRIGVLGLVAALGLALGAGPSAAVPVSGLVCEGGVTPAGTSGCPGGIVLGDFNSDVTNPTLEVEGDTHLFGGIAHRSTTQFLDSWTMDFGTDVYNGVFSWQTVFPADDATASGLFDGTLTVGGADFFVTTDNTENGDSFAIGSLTGSVTFVFDAVSGDFDFNPDEVATWDLEVTRVPLPAGGLLLLTALGGVAALRRKRKAA